MDLSETLRARMLAPVSEDLRDRAAGSILGLAVGDSLGAPFEFRRTTEIPDPLPAFEDPWMGFPPWDERCATACLAVTLAVAALVRGEEPEPAVVAAVRAVVDREGGVELEYLVGEAGRARQVDGPQMGFALFTAGIALQVAGED